MANTPSFVWFGLLEHACVMESRLIADTKLVKIREATCRIGIQTTNALGFRLGPNLRVSTRARL